MIELIDIYDAECKPTGETVPRGTALRDGQYQLYVTAIVQDAAGRFLITQRSPDKSWGAGWWEFTGGGVPAGETAEQAVVREVAEEVGLDASPHVTAGTGPQAEAGAASQPAAGAGPQLIWHYRNDDPEGGDNYFMNIFRICIDFSLQDVTLQAEEAVDCRLVSWDDICALNEQGIFLHFNRIARALENR